MVNVHVKVLSYVVQQDFHKIQFDINGRHEEKK